MLSRIHHEFSQNWNAEYNITTTPNMGMQQSLRSEQRKSEFFMIYED